MKFVYEGFDTQGEPQGGALEADNRLEALRELQRKGITPVELVPVETRRSRLPGTRLTSAHIAQAFHELTRLLESSVSIAESIEAMSEAGHHERLDQAFSAIARDLQRGETFSTALERCGLPLPGYLLHLVRAGEMTGDLGGALRRAHDKMQYDNNAARDLRNALVYPSILVSAGTAAVLLMFIVVVPKFSGMLDKNGADLPALATFVLSAGTWFNAHWHALLATLAATLAGLTLSLRQPRARAALLNGLSRAPVIGRWLEETDLAGWAYTLAAMLGCKVELLAALQLSADAIRIPRRRAAMQDLIRQIRAGRSLSGALADTHLLNRTGINLVKVGERTGHVAEMLDSLAGIYEENGKSRMKKLLALIEPVAILVIGSIIGVIILGIILAITSVNELAI